ncbi:MAG: aspartate carbamoyltransferase catalytic subunit [Planctomycetes bacterium]|nr:aspartate carbamoyltransferase catalytic subunit [Planctomycetota bacterium]MBZ0151975.1 aspartate carbamoyltransferase catalytic subunit [Planctomycetota bacterium]
MANQAKRDLVSIEDLSTAEILELFHHADEFRANLLGWSDLCRGTIMATLFFEPSTRTRLSFESSMLRLGGGVITAADEKNTSRSKGESLADTVRVVGGSYADILVVRHPEDGAARVAARYANVPVINGGDGAHEHPTQTLCDLYTLWKQKGRLEGLEIVLCGDLRYSRTIHSFCYALARFGANIVTMPYPGFELPDYVLHRLRREFGVQTAAASVSDLPGIAGSSNAAAYLTASKPHQLALYTNLTNVEVNRIDAIYMTRAQRERHSGEETLNYPRLTRSTLGAAAAKDASIMHPLPRVDEIDYEIDDDPRSIYFRQAELGVPMRMALMAFLLGKIQLRAGRPATMAVAPGIVAGPGLRCRNERCITNNEGVRYLVRDFRLRDNEVPPLLTCAYCEREIEARFVGDSQARTVFRYNAPEARHVEPAHRVYFESEAQAQAAGYGAAGG